MFFSARLLSSLIVWGTSFACAGAWEPAKPHIPMKEFKAADFGLVANAEMPVTEALQRAIDRVAAAGGGRLVIEPGNYATGPITLPGEFDLHLSKGATLKMLPREAGYPSDARSFVTVFSKRLATQMLLPS